MSLVSVGACRDLVRTSLEDGELQAIIDRVEAELVSRIGPFQDETGAVETTETGVLMPGNLILTKQPIETVVSVSVGGNPIASTGLSVRGGAGMVKIVWVIATTPPTSYTIVYRPMDQRAALTQAIIDLVRLTLERTAMRSESVAGEYHYQAPDWERERLRIIRRVCPAVV